MRRPINGCATIRRMACSAIISVSAPCANRITSPRLAITRRSLSYNPIMRCFSTTSLGFRASWATPRRCRLPRKGRGLLPRIPRSSAAWGGRVAAEDAVARRRVFLRGAPRGRPGAGAHANSTKGIEVTVVAVVGLGYVGLPLAVEFGKKYTTVGFDLSEKKIAAYRNFLDPTGEVSQAELKAASGLRVTTDAADLANADFVVVAVPTPVDQAHQPDFGPLLSASAAVGQNLKRGATVVFESTVYPGATEEVCVPVLERSSGLQWRRDFFVGY